VSLITEQLDGEPIVAAGSRSNHFMVAFKLPHDQEDRTYSAVQDALPKIMKDTEGNIYDIFGRVAEGPDAGTHLETVHSFIAFWFAWGAFYPGIEIYENISVEH